MKPILLATAAPVILCLTTFGAQTQGKPEVGPFAATPATAPGRGRQ